MVKQNITIKSALVESLCVWKYQYALCTCYETPRKLARVELKCVGSGWLTLECRTRKDNLIVVFRQQNRDPPACLTAIYLIQLVTHATYPTHFIMHATFYRENI